MLLESFGLKLLEEVGLPAQHTRVVGTDLEVVRLDKSLVNLSYLLKLGNAEAVWDRWLRSDLHDLLKLVVSKLADSAKLSIASVLNRRNTRHRLIKQVKFGSAAKVVIVQLVLTLVQR